MINLKINTDIARTRISQDTTGLIQITNSDFMYRPPEVKNNKNCYNNTVFKSSSTNRKKKKTCIYVFILKKLSCK